MGEEHRELARGSVTFLELIFQSVSFTAPAIAALATMTGAASFAYGALPLAYLFSIPAVFAAAYVVYEFSRSVASSGGYYRYIERGFGPRVGAFGGWVYMLYTVIGATPFIYFETSLAIIFGLQALGISLPSYSWYPLGLLVAVLAFLLAYFGIKPSLRYSVYTGTIEMVLIFILGIVILLRAPHPWDPGVYSLKYSPLGLMGVGLGMVFAFTSYAGWGSMTFLGGEAKQAHVNIRRGVIATITLLVIFFTFASYTMTVGWGPNNMSTYFSNFVPGLIEAVKYGGFILASIIFIFMANSGFVDTVAIINAGSRDMYTMAKDNALPSQLSLTHKKYKSPHISLIVMTAVGIALFTITGWVLGPLNAFLVTGLWTGLGTLIDHIMVNAALPFYMKKKNRLNSLHVIIPIIAILIFGFAIYASFTSINIYVIIGTTIVAAWLIAGAILYYRKKDLRVKLEQGEEI